MSEIDVVSGAAAGSASKPRARRFFSGYSNDAVLHRLLAAADALTIAAAAAIVGLWGSGPAGALLLVLSAPVWIVTAKLVGLYDRDHRTLRHLTVEELPWIIVWALGGTAVLTLLVAPFPGLALSSNDRLFVWSAALVLGFAFRGAARALWRRTTPPERLLIVGEGPLADAVTRKLELFPDIHATVAARVPTCTELADRLDEIDRVDRVVVACAELNEELLETLLPACRLRGVKLTIVPPTRGIFGTATHLGHVAELPLLDYNTWYVSPSTLALKRIFDVVVATVALVATVPLFLVIGLAIVVDDGWPVFFRQLRAGENGRRFRIFKFRTMVRDAEARLPELVSLDELSDPMFKLRSDPRVTRVGRFLRRTSLDELPQLLNVLRGEMSIVGPRPELVDLVERYAPEHEVRLRVKPGITGPWQVYGRSDLTFDEVLAVEREYVENLSLGRDLRIVLMTIPAVFGRRGAY
ncbi:MAG TPA: exopolysaccharide biosynthesis polyprenyl glycosylphosphotransferase [Gaiellaceae bacterium]|nr:exopolysaccharide biosynthesis polyprenyl glycosylphosphotransferase [Gaiellaceae bacterium]